jgi:hypothetical protein
MAEEGGAAQGSPIVDGEIDKTRKEGKRTKRNGRKGQHARNQHE